MNKTSKAQNVQTLKPLKSIKYDQSYISYVENGKSVAVLIARDLIDKIDTTGKWIDVVELSSFEKMGHWGFNYIIIELFPRKIKPKYPVKTMNEQENNAIIKYITWKTANEDISIQRGKGIKGEVYLILCDLYNSNKNNYEEKLLFWNERFQQWTKYKTSSCTKTKKVKVYCGTDTKNDDWKYNIRGIKELSHENLKEIQLNIERYDDVILNRRKLQISDFCNEK